MLIYFLEYALMINPKNLKVLTIPKNLKLIINILKKYSQKLQYKY